MAVKKNNGNKIVLDKYMKDEVLSEGQARYKQHRP